jgi:hypothetical protein
MLRRLDISSMSRHCSCYEGQPISPPIRPGTVLLSRLALPIVQSTIYDLYLTHGAGYRPLFRAKRIASISSNSLHSFCNLLAHSHLGKSAPVLTLKTSAALRKLLR